MTVWTATQAHASRTTQAREAVAVLAYHYGRAVKSIALYTLGRVSMG